MNWNDGSSTGDVGVALLAQASERYDEHYEYYQGEGISKEALQHGVLRNEFNDSFSSEKAEKKRKELVLKELFEVHQLKFTSRNGADDREWD